MATERTLDGKPYAGTSYVAFSLYYGVAGRFDYVETVLAKSIEARSFLKSLLPIVSLALILPFAVFAAGGTTKVTFINSSTNEKIGDYEYPQYATYGEARLWDNVPWPYGNKAAGWVDAKTGKVVHNYDMVSEEITELKSALWNVQEGDKDYEIGCRGEILLVPKGEGQDDISLNYERLKYAIPQQEDDRDVSGIAIWARVVLNGVYRYERDDEGTLKRKWEYGTFSGTVNLVMYAPNGVFLRQKIGNANLSTSPGGNATVNIRHFIPIDELELGCDYQFYIEVIQDSSGLNSLIYQWSSNVPLPLSFPAYAIRVSAQSADVVNKTLTLTWESTDVNRDISQWEFSVWRSSGLIQDGRSIRNETVKCIKEKVVGTSFTDNSFGMLPGSDVVRYWIVPKGGARWRDNGHPKLAHSVDTRRRVCLSVGLDFYAREQSKNITGHKHDATEAELFAELIENGGGIVGGDGTWYVNYPVVVLTGSDATPTAFTNSFTRMSEKCNPGDVFFFYVATHGVAPSSGDPKFDNPTFALYADTSSRDPSFQKGHFTNLDMATLLAKSSLKSKGVKFIGVVNTCYSGDFVKSFENIDEFNNTAWIASSGEGKEAFCGDLYSRFGLVFLNWGWRDMEAKRDTITMKGGAVVSSPNKENDSQINLFEIAGYAGLFLDYRATEIQTPLSEQKITLVNSELLKHTDVVDMVDDKAQFASRPSSPDFSISEDGRCMKFTPIIAKEDRVFGRLIAAEFVPNKGGQVGTLCYCPYPDEEYGLRRDYLLFTKDQAEHYNYGHEKNKGVTLFLDDYNKNWGLIDPASSFLEPDTEYECRAWTISPAGWSSESFPRVFETMGFVACMWKLWKNANIEYQGFSEISTPSIDGGRASRLGGTTKSADMVFVSLTTFVYPGEEDRVYFDVTAVDSTGKRHIYLADVYESSIRLDENGTPIVELAIPSSMDDLGDVKIILKGLEMFGTIGAYSFAGHAYARKCDFKDDEFVYWDETLRSDDYSYEPELTVSPPEINEDDLLFTIKLDACGGKVSPGEFSARYGETYGERLPTPTRSGYNFNGWFTYRYGSADYIPPITSASTVVASGTLYASWSYAGSGGGDDPFTYECEVTFDANGGTCSETNRVVESGKAIGALPTPVLNGYKFLGWFDDPEDEDGWKISATTKIYMDETYYAHWQFDGSAMVTVAVAEGCEAMGKVSGGNATFKAGAKVSLKATANKGYVFVGWRRAEDSAPYQDGELLSQAVSFTYVATGEPITIVAVFASTGDDAESLKVEVADDVSTDADGMLSLDLGECVESLSQPKLTVSGLPSGLKYDAKTCVISGKVTKPGVYVVKVTATNASATGKNAVVKEFTITVPNLTSELFTAAGLKSEESYVLQAGIAPDLKDVVAAVAGGGWKLAVSGLPSGVKYDAKSGRFTGVATKEGFSTVYFTATRGSGKSAEKQVATVTFEVVFPKLALSMAAWGDVGATNKCKVAGGGKYPFGKKVTIKATPGKGSVFMGWTDGECAVVSQTASWSLTMPSNDVEYIAKFVTADEDKASITLAVAMAAEAEAIGLSTNEIVSITNFCGVAMRWQLAAEALSATTIKVAGLPSGLKFTAKDILKKGSKTEVDIPANTIYGAPTAASKTDKKTGAVTPAKVKITVTTAGKSTQAFAIDLYIDPLPAWAVGTFDGATYAGDSVEASGLVQAFTVAVNGKISGKLLRDDGTWTLSADSFASYDATNDVYLATVIGKNGKLLETNEVKVAASGVTGTTLSEAAVTWTAYQNLWKRADTKAEQPVFKKNIDKVLELGDANNTLKLTFKKDGAVAFAGKVGGASVSGSSQLVNDGEGWKVTLYAPAKGTFAGFCRTLAVTLTIGDQMVVTDVTVGSNGGGDGGSSWFTGEFNGYGDVQFPIAGGDTEFLNGLFTINVAANLAFTGTFTGTDGSTAPFSGMFAKDGSSYVATGVSITVKGKTMSMGLMCDPGPYAGSDEGFGEIGGGSEDVQDEPCIALNCAWQNIWKRTDLAAEWKPAFAAGTEKTLDLKDTGLDGLSDGDSLTYAFGADGAVSITGKIYGESVNATATLDLEGLDSSNGTMHCNFFFLANGHLYQQQFTFPRQATVTAADITLDSFVRID